MIISDNQAMDGDEESIYDNSDGANFYSEGESDGNNSLSD